MSIPPHIPAGHGRPATLISYASQDEKAAAEVADQLLSAGHGVWLDKYCLLAGQD
ncbi:toll/interleukin-1 receptor domain-containing protein [Actinoplanes sp. TRM 88003]|uniref:Toll/interleukin-1 receptor domain-containing protein n=1 Tax=Paractinoplanes aksuensis TaxID=2939490 RepID=A0ABT1DGR2_9ACTN|nr:toll/interleukin-1 receptor domain-containing protein [Actinoplanes aksuensis]MCO8269984.1 toll/interleukin-1 receptor domain-containing protein [Actinoplanes aksuensis]